MKHTFIGLARLGFGLLSIVAIATQLGRQIQYNLSIVNFFSYFTNLSNLLAAVMLMFTGIYLLCNTRLGKVASLMQGASVLNMLVVGVVFSVLLRGEDLGTLLPWVNTVLHYIMPIIVVADWVLWPPKMRITYRHIRYWLILPILYLIYVLLRGAHVHWYPYPFVNPSKAGGYLGVSLYCLGITVLFALAGYGLVWIQGKRRT